MEKKEVKIRIFGMSCDDCALTIEKNLKMQDGILDAKISYEDREGTVSIDSSRVKDEEILKNKIFSPQSRYKAIIKRE